jgi:hypothetical protein
MLLPVYPSNLPNSIDALKLPTPPIRASLDMNPPHARPKIDQDVTHDDVRAAVDSTAFPPADRAPVKSCLLPTPATAAAAAIASFPSDPSLPQGQLEDRRGLFKRLAHV